MVERGARIGAGTVLKSRVTVSEGCTVGERCILHAGVVIGADGFGFAPNDGGGKRSSNWAPCASATTWKLAPTPA
jgi:UDP-3-O-[3-hydroxymyristoyl] glucosamine N-acyltransferase